MTLPNLFVIGAPKSGTTALHHYLDAHPHIAMSARKEPKYFLTDGTRPSHAGPGDERACRAYVTDRAEYEALFTRPPGAPSYAGESTPYYLWDDRAAGRIHAVVPDARLIAVLREPTARAYSNWADLREQGREKLDFATALDAEDERRRLDWEPFWQYRSLGLYGEQLTRLYGVFPPSQVAVVVAEELAVDPDGVLGRLLDFLGLDPLPGPAERTRRNQTMYGPVDRLGRLAQAGFGLGERLRPVVPRSVRRLSRSAVRRTLRSRATAGGHGARLRAQFAALFADDRRTLETLEGPGVDLAKWWNGPGER